MIFYPSPSSAYCNVDSKRLIPTFPFFPHLILNVCVCVCVLCVCVCY